MISKSIVKFEILHGYQLSSERFTRVKEAHLLRQDAFGGKCREKPSYASPRVFSLWC